MLNNIIFLFAICICISAIPSFSRAQQQYVISKDTNVINTLAQLPETSLFYAHLLRDPTITSYIEDNKNRDITIFAPNNDAFTMNDTIEFGWYYILPTSRLDWNAPRFERTLWKNQLLKLSCVNNTQKVVISGMMHSANIVKTLYHANNVIHVIDRKLTLPVDMNTTLTKLGYTKARDLFKKRIQNLTAEVTLFVPNNKAFGTVDPTTMEDIFAQTHASRGLITSNMWENTTSFETLFDGINLTVVRNANFWEAQESASFPAKIAFTDILLENGVMHLIEQVLWANDWDRITKSKSNASQTQPIIWSLALIMILSLLSC